MVDAQFTTVDKQVKVFHPDLLDQGRVCQSYRWLKAYIVPVNLACKTNVWKIQLKENCKLLLLLTILLQQLNLNNGRTAA